MTAEPSELGTRDKLLEAALKEFCSSGFEVSARHIERTAQVERGLIAYHFGSKESLWNEAVDSVFAQQFEELQSLRGALRDVAHRERAKAVLMAHTRFNARHPELFRLFIIEGHRRNQRSERVAKHVLQTIELFRDLAGFEGAVDTEQAMLIYMIIGAAGTVFATSAYADEIFGCDVQEPEFIERFARGVAALGLSQGFDTSAP